METGATPVLHVFAAGLSSFQLDRSGSEERPQHYIGNSGLWLT